MSLSSLPGTARSGRLPYAGHPAVRAGYIAGAAAICSAAIYAAASLVIESMQIGVSPMANVGLALLALPVIVPVAFTVGTVGWAVFAPTSSLLGAIGGTIAVLFTYGGALLVFGIPLTAAEFLLGTTPLRTAVFAWGVVYLGFLETWWITFPIGAVAGYGSVRALHG